MIKKYKEYLVYLFIFLLFCIIYFIFYDKGIILKDDENGVISLVTRILDIIDICIMIISMILLFLKPKKRINFIAIIMLNFILLLISRIYIPDYYYNNKCVYNSLCKSLNENMCVEKAIEINKCSSDDCIYIGYSSDGSTTWCCCTK